MLISHSPWPPPSSEPVYRYRASGRKRRPDSLRKDSATLYQIDSDFSFTPEFVVTDPKLL